MLDARDTSIGGANSFEELLKAAASFDAHFSKLSLLLSRSESDPAPSLDPDRRVAQSVLTGMADDCTAIAAHLDKIEEGQRASASARQLLVGLKRMVGLERSHIQLDSSRPSMSTPPSISRPAKKERPSVSTPTRSGNSMDFDEYPSTPTLEQLGLSGHALAVVGDHMMVTDSESDMQMDLGRRSFDSSSSIASAPHLSSPRSSLLPPTSQQTPHTPMMSHGNGRNESSPYPFGSPLAAHMHTRDQLQ